MLSSRVCPVLITLIIIWGASQAIRLTGFNWPLEHVHTGDGALMKQQIADTNLARIIGVRQLRHH